MNNQLSHDLSVATRSAYDTHLNHALKQRAYERESGDQSNDPTRVHTNVEQAIKRKLGPNWTGFIEMELDDMGNLNCKVYAGDRPEPEMLTAQWTHNRTSVT